MKIKTITHKEACLIIHYCIPKGLYLFPHNGKWGALDNSTGDSWTRVFDTQVEAKEWLISF